MKNKTCGECKYFKQNEEICLHDKKHYWSKKEFDACTGFEAKPVTNGDVIRQGNNRKLAEIFDDLYSGNKCKYCIHHAGSSVCKLNPTPYSEYDEGYLDDENCLNGFEAWLNAPAESEVNNG